MQDQPASKAPRQRHPLFWVPSLYLAMGIPNATVSIVSAIMYKNLGYSNETIALYTSQMYLPWVLKPIWAPFLEPYLSKRSWVLTMEFLMAAALGLVAFSLPLSGFFRLSLAFFWITGFASATQDIAADAVFMTTLHPKEQAKYAGVQGMCWNAGSVLTSGLLVTLTGRLHDGMHYGWITAWMAIIGFIAVSLALCGVWHLRVLPPGEPSHLKGRGLKSAFLSLEETWVSFFRKDQIWMMLLVVFMYRFGEGFIERFGQLFLMDSRAVGGLGLSNTAIGNLYGSLGTIGFIAGALLGGFFAARMTLRRSFVWLAIALNVPHLTYYYLSVAMPHSLAVIGTVVTLEKFAFGFGSVGHMLYMMQQIAPGNFKMSHYAFATGVMAATKWGTGTISGFVYDAVSRSYPHFFLVVVLLSIPPVVLAKFAPFPQPDSASEPAPATGH